MTLANLTILLALVAGAVTALQAPTNALLAKAFGSPITAAFISFAVGTVALAAILFFMPARMDQAAVRALPWYAWVGGLYGAVFVTVAAFAAPRIGVGPLLTAVVAGQLLTAVALDHAGILGLPRQPVSGAKVAGLLMVIAGAALVRRG